MTTAIVDYDSGNLHSAAKAFERMAAQKDAGPVVVTSDADVVARADRVVLPGDGAFPACKAALMGRSGLFEAIEDAVIRRAVPFFGICIGMQMMARLGHETQPTQGFGWLDGEVVPIRPRDASFKVPHMGWNDLVVDRPHPVLHGISTGDHVYFVHSYHMALTDPAQLLAHVDYGHSVTAVAGRDTMFGTQFHPEKSQAVGLRLIANFFAWKP